MENTQEMLSLLENAVNLAVNQGIMTDSEADALEQWVRLQAGVND